MEMVKPSMTRPRFYPARTSGAGLWVRRAMDGITFVGTPTTLLRLGSFTVHA
jgi:hypothetical protein